MATLYFGPEYARKDYEIQVNTPVGDLCLHCEEAIEDGDVGTITPVIMADQRAVMRAEHHECRMRQVIGSAAHVAQTCSCYVPGSREGDDPSLTMREAAVAALQAWKARQ